MLVVPPGQVVCVAASGQPGRGFESAVMPKVKLVLAIFRFLLVFAGISPQLQSFSGINFNYTCIWEDPFVLSSLSPIIRRFMVHFSSYLSTPA